MTDSQSLSDRELEVLRLVAQGATNQQIAHELSISSNTVKVHLRNIYGKLGVVSRTEATIEAVRRGLISLPGALQEGAEEPPATSVTLTLDEDQQERPAARVGEAEETSLAQTIVATPTALSQSARQSGQQAQQQETPRRSLHTSHLIIAGAAVLLTLVVALAAMLLRQQQPPPPESERSVGRAGWELRASLPRPRADLALALSGGQIYAIGGEGSDGISAEVWRYDPANDSWQQLAAKPMPVARIRAAVLGGKIYVAGGRTSTGAPTEILEVYDPHADTWESRAALPEPRSGHAVAALEGKLYLFGGRGERGFSNKVFIYNPVEDRWSEGPTMPMALAHSAAVALEEKGEILVISGENSDGPQTSTLRFSPRESEPWQMLEPLPAPRAHAAAVELAGRVFLIGTSDTDAAVLSYDLRDGQWIKLNLQHGGPLTRMGAIVAGSEVYTIGGWDGTQLLSQNRIFHPIHLNYLPLAPGGK